MKKIVLILVVLAVSTAGLIADESAPRIISSIKIVQNEPIRTNEAALLKYMDLIEGQLFADAAEFTVHVERELQDLKNTRYFAEVTLVPTEGEVDSQGNIPVEIVVTTTDAWTLLPIPYPLPDSQIGKNGWAFGLELNYNNFLGTMTDFYMDSNVKMAFGETELLRSWKVNPELRNVKMGSLEFDFKYKQLYEINQSFNESDVLLQRYSSHNSSFAVGTEMEFNGDWFYGFEPSLEFNYGYDWSSGDRQLYGLAHDRDSNGVLINREDIFIFGFDHFVRQGRVNWVDTFRSGYELELRNVTGLGIARPADTTENEFVPVTDLNLSASYYLPFAKVLNYYTRGQALFVFGEIRKGLGDDIRGVKNSSMQGDIAFFWQNTLVIQPHKPNTKFNFQFHPFVDVGMAFTAANAGSFSDMIRLGVGTELVIMLGGIDLRGRIGIDPINYAQTQFLDFSFATGMSY